MSMFRLAHLHTKIMFNSKSKNRSGYKTATFKTATVTKQRLLQNSDSYKTATATKQRLLQNSNLTVTKRRLLQENILNIQ